MKKHPLGWQKTSGFTLVELLVVITIIAILVGISALTISGTRQRSKVAQVTAQMVGLSTAIDQYYAVFDAYPGPFRPERTSRDRVVTGTQNLLLGLACAVYEGSNSATGADAAVAERKLPHNNSNGNPGGPTYYTDAGKPFSVLDRANNKKHNAFYNFTSKNLSPMGQLTQDEQDETGLLYDWPRSGVRHEIPANGGYQAVYSAAGGWRFPTIIDAFDDPLPILYYRRTPSVEGTGEAENNQVKKANNNIVKLAYEPTDPTTMAPYYFMDNAHYTDDPNRPYKGMYEQPKLFVGVAGGVVFPQGQDFMSDNDGRGKPLAFTPEILADRVSTIMGTSASVRGGYVLISAGPDRTYGNAGTRQAPRNLPTATDDIVIVGGN